MAVAIWLLSESALILTGQALVSLVSLGRWRAERVAVREGRNHSAAGALSFKRDGQGVITASGLLLAGLAFYAVLGGLLFKLVGA